MFLYFIFAHLWEGSRYKKAFHFAKENSCTAALALLPLFFTSIHFEQSCRPVARSRFRGMKRTLVLICSRVSLVDWAGVDSLEMWVLVSSSAACSSGMNSAMQKQKGKCKSHLLQNHISLHGDFLKLYEGVCLRCIRSCKFEEIGPGPADLKDLVSNFYQSQKQGANQRRGHVASHDQYSTSWLTARKSPRSLRRGLKSKFQYSPVRRIVHVWAAVCLWTTLRVRGGSARPGTWWDTARSPAQTSPTPGGSACSRRSATLQAMKIWGQSAIQ